MIKAIKHGRSRGRFLSGILYEIRSTLRTVDLYPALSFRNAKLFFTLRTLEIRVILVLQLLLFAGDLMDDL